MQKCFKNKTKKGLKDKKGNKRSNCRFFFWFMNILLWFLFISFELLAFLWEKWYIVIYVCFILLRLESGSQLKYALNPGAVSEFYSGGCHMASEASQKNLIHPCRGLPIFTGGYHPLIHKHINRGLTYDTPPLLYTFLKWFIQKKNCDTLCRVIIFFIAEIKYHIKNKTYDSPIVIYHLLKT